MKTVSERLLESPPSDDLRWFRKEEIDAERPVPYCCPRIAGSRAVLAGFPSADGQVNDPPIWYIPSGHRYLGTSPALAMYCPFCGASLPDLVLKARLPYPVCSPDRLGHGCDTCGCSGGHCQCYPPECSWEAKDSPPVFAAVCFMDKLEKLRGNMSRLSFLSVSRKDNHSMKGFPGGRVEEGEDPEDAARRELLEETGYVAGHMHKIFDAIDDAKVRVVAYRVETYIATSSTLESGLVEWVPMSSLVKSSPYSSFNSALFNLLGIRSA